MKAAELGITPEAYVREGLQFVSMRTMIEMSEVAQMALFLSSAAARHVSDRPSEYVAMLNMNADTDSCPENESCALVSDDCHGSTARNRHVRG
jgi:hypothetical protein